MLGASILSSSSFRSLCYSAICTWSKLKSTGTYGFSAMLMSSCADDCVGLLSAAVTVGKMPVSEGDKVVLSGFFISAELVSLAPILIMFVLEACAFVTDYLGRSHRFTS